MIHDIKPCVYDNSYTPVAPEGHNYVLLCKGQEAVCKIGHDGTLFLPRVKDFASCQYRYLFSIDEDAFFMPTGGDIKLPVGFSFESLRTMRTARPRKLAFAVVTAASLTRWYDLNCYCGRCRTAMEESKSERALVCPSCENTVYPRINPAVIVAVRDGERLLVTRYAGRPYKNYALIAGFAETGETIEETVLREVKEETGITVKNPEFYKSQPWGFSDSLLFGFFCDLDGTDELIVDKTELATALWVQREDLPDDEETVSLTMEMMTLFKKGDK